MLPISHPVPINSVTGEMPMAPAALAGAFADFSEAAASLERSYGELQVEVTQLRKIVAERNRALHSSLAENARIRQTLEVILDSLPCGVLVLDTSSQNPTLINPEARRLLGINNSGDGRWGSISTDIRNRLTELLATAFLDGNDAELCISGGDGKRWLAVRGRRLDVSDGMGEVTTEAGH